MQRYVILFCLINSVVRFVYTQEGDSCKLPYTGYTGVCKLVKDCPAAAQLANSGYQPKICGIKEQRWPVVCCALEENLRPNTFLPNIEETIIFPENGGGSVAEKMCEEYRKHVYVPISALPLVSDSTAVTVYVKKCEYDKVPLIVGGEKADVGEFPHMAAIGFNTIDGIQYQCGGTLISDRFVVTAAHCTSSQNGRPVRIRLGDHNLNSVDDGAEPEEFDVAEIIRHPELKPKKKYNDIALIRLSRKVNFSKFIRPACLYTKNDIKNQKAVATGWGLTTDGGKPSDILLKVALDLMSNTQCNNYYRNEFSLPEGIKSTMLCAGDLQGRKDTCQGDSGGPLVISDPDNQCLFYLVGITSFGKSCAHANSPAVYTRVSEYVDWIESVVWP